ncbi:stimulated by retinoic acid gene 6 protein-like isoform X2 [Pangasianodon hypophthalmus]|uniref:stimulated by retinoic acid gene 6 protein-like isoform X2 n=1 Tax=Pangasianodon hypophthalmus TaxID=310915 RepID=UPI0023077A90|nr:stimulated by retinoic acid gene 6 protein-like isoform X2 [Pangasianodon hypophthalmus]
MRISGGNTTEQSAGSQEIPANPTDETDLWLQCNTFYELFMPLSLLVSVFIILLLSFVERRKKIWDCERRFSCLSGRFGFVVPLDFTGKMQNRWSYGFAFGAVTPFVINLMFNSIIRANVPPYLQVLVALLTALVLSIVCMPLFACLSTPHRLLGGVLGLLYSLSWFVALMWKLIWCRAIAPNDNFVGYLLWSVWLFNVPQLLCLGFLVCRFGSIIVKGVQNRLRNYSKQEEVEKHEYKYVQRLLRWPAEASVQKSWFQREVYEWDPYFKFPNRIIATVVLSFFGVYMIVTSEQIISWWLTSNMYAIWKKYLKHILDQTSFFTHLNYVTYTWYISAACATLTSVIHISQVLVYYRKHMESLRAGEKKYLPKTYKLDPVYGVVGLLKYPGYQIAFSVWGYLIMHIAMFVVGLVFVYLVVSPIREHGFLHWLKWVGMSLPNFFILLAVMGLQRMLSHLFFLQDKTSPTDEDKPLALNNRETKLSRKAFHNFNYYLFFCNVILGVMSCFLRLIKSAAVGLMLLSRIERTIMPEGFEKQDTSYCMWVGMIMADHYHTNPVLVCFCHLLLKHTSESVQDGEYSRLNSEPISKDRVRTRWLLVYTLLRNPKLILLRKKRKQKNDKEGELAFAWAISNKA